MPAVSDSQRLAFIYIQLSVAMPNNDCICVSQRRKPPPVELNPRTLVPEGDVDAPALELTEEPTLPLAVALALPPPETETIVVTDDDELPALLVAPAEPAMAWLALNISPINRHEDDRPFTTFIDVSPMALRRE
ncbi:MAG: hypothetical protein ACREH9_07920 [Pseudomonadota bacterium]